MSLHFLLLFIVISCVSRNVRLFFFSILNPLTVTPEIVAFKGSVEMKHLEEAVLNYQILGFHPKQVTVIL